MKRLLTLAAVAAALPLAGLTRADPAPATPAGVYVAPFRAIDSDAAANADESAVGQAVRQTVTATLARRAATVVAGDPAPADAVAAGRTAGARYAVTGSVESVAGRLRIAGEVVDLTTGTVVAGLAATGNATDRLDLEDEVAAQAGRAVRPPAAADHADALKASDLLTLADPPYTGDRYPYAGSRLQQSLDINRTPANDFAQRVNNARTNNTFGSYNNYAYPAFGFFGFGSYGYGGLGFGGFGYAAGLGGRFGGVAAPYGDYVVHTAAF